LIETNYLVKFVWGVTSRVHYCTLQTGKIQKRDHFANKIKTDTSPKQNLNTNKVKPETSPVTMRSFWHVDEGKRNDDDDDGYNKFSLQNSSFTRQDTSTCIAISSESQEVGNNIDDRQDDEMTTTSSNEKRMHQHDVVSEKNIRERLLQLDLSTHEQRNFSTETARSFSGEAFCGSSSNSSSSFDNPFPQSSFSSPVNRRSDDHMVSPSPGSYPSSEKGSGSISSGGSRSNLFGTTGTFGQKESGSSSGGGGRGGGSSSGGGGGSSSSSSSGSSNSNHNGELKETEVLRGEHWVVPSWSVEPCDQYVLESRKKDQLLSIIRVDQQNCYRFGRNTRYDVCHCRNCCFYYPH
jgi:hypothetical protein